MKQLNIIDLNVEIWILILCPILVIFIMIKELSSLAWVSTIANCFMAFGILSIFVHLIRNARNPLELPKFSGWSVFPLFFGIAVFAFDVIPVVSIFYIFNYYVIQVDFQVKKKTLLPPRLSRGYFPDHLYFSIHA